MGVIPILVCSQEVLIKGEYMELTTRSKKFLFKSIVK